MSSTAGSPDCAGGTGGAWSTGRGPLLLVNMSIAIRPTPTQMATSATLNVGQWCSPTPPKTRAGQPPGVKTWKSMKSMTCP